MHRWVLVVQPLSDFICILRLRYFARLDGSLLVYLRSWLFAPTVESFVSTSGTRRRANERCVAPFHLQRRVLVDQRMQSRIVTLGRSGDMNV
jgi:hypothetical protein